MSLINSQNLPLISIVIPTYNEERNIERLLISIKNQDYDNVEIIIIDQSSTDNTINIAKKYTKHIIIIPKPKFYSPPGKNRNVGARKAKGKILIHLDADMELPDLNFLNRLLCLFDKTHQAVIIHEIDIANGYWNKCKALERRFYWNTDMEAARAVTKSLFVRINGYDEDINSGEDFYISQQYKKNTKITSDDKLFLYHYTGNLPLSKLLRKKFDYGKTAHMFINKSTLDKTMHVNVVKVSLCAYAKNYKFFFSDPKYFIGILILRVLEYIALNFGRLCFFYENQALKKFTNIDKFYS